MSFIDAVKSGFSNYITIEGRAARSEYWFWVLFIIIGNIVLGFADGVGGLFTIGESGILSSLFSLGTLLPSLMVAIRRLHDLDRSGWWMLLIFIPVIGGLILLFFFVQKGSDGDNRFGADPLAGMD